MRHNRKLFKNQHHKYPLFVLIAIITITLGLISIAGTNNASTLSVYASPPFMATGFFHTAFKNGRWWLVTPDGYPFYISGVDHVSSSPDVDRTTNQCPYCEAIAAQYPNVGAWETATVQQLRSWGFNALGPWSDSSLFDKMPYTILLSMASGSDWFANSFVTNAYQQAKTQVAPYKNDPNLIGYFTDSELRWGPDWTSQLSLLDAYLRLPLGSPGRAVAMRYVHNPSGFETALAQRYFSVTTAAIRSVDPNHMILGVKMIAQLATKSLLEVASKYVDCFSIDDYTVIPLINNLLPSTWPSFIKVQDNLAGIYKFVHKPLIIGEYSFRASGGNDPNTWPPIYPTYPNQTARATAYTNYVSSLYKSPYIVGDFWFEYVDEPPGGRFDGENSDFGLVSTSNVPWTALVDAATQMHQNAPDRVADPNEICWLWQYTTGGVTCKQTYPVCPNATPLGPQLTDWPYCKLE